MGKDARESARGFRGHLRKLARDRAAAARDADAFVWMSPKSVLTVVGHGIEWLTYCFITWGLVYLVMTDRMPKLIKSDTPQSWLDYPKVAGFTARVPAQDVCLAIVEDTAPLGAAGDLSPEFKRGFEAAVQVMIGRLEQR